VPELDQRRMADSVDGAVANLHARSQGLEGKFQPSRRPMGRQGRDFLQIAPFRPVIPLKFRRLCADWKHYRNHNGALSRQRSAHSSVFSGRPSIRVGWGQPARPGSHGPMTLDIHTLFLVTTYVEAILGLLLLFAWAQNMALHAVCWWGFAHLIRLTSIALFGMYGSVPDVVSIDLANALLFTAYAATWTGARVFDGRPVEPVYLVTGAVLWLLICRLPVLADHANTRALIVAGIITSYIWLTAYEFWRGRSEPLVSRWPAIIMFFAHGALFLLRTPMIALLPVAANS